MFKKVISEGSPQYKRIAAIIHSDIWEVARQPIFFFSVAFFSLWIFASPLFTLFAFGQEMVMVREMGLSSMVVCGLWIIFFSGVHLVTREIDQKTTYTLLSKPLTRGEFIIAKYLSIFLLSLLALLLLSVVFSLVIWRVEHTIEESLFQGIFLVGLELAFFSSLSLGLSLFLPPLLNFLFFFLFFSLGHLHQHITETAKSLLGEGGSIVVGIGALLPDLELLNLSSEVALKKVFPLSYLLVAFSYGILYTFLILLVTFLGFEQKEL